VEFQLSNGDRRSAGDSFISSLMNGAYLFQPPYTHVGPLWNAGFSQESVQFHRKNAGFGEKSRKPKGP